VGYAVNTVAQPGDEVIVAPGNYSVPSAGLTANQIDLHGLEGQMRPVLTATGTGPAVSANGGSTVRSLRIEQPNADSAALYTTGYASRVVLIASGQGGAGAVVVSGGVLSDSIVYAGAPYGEAVVTQYTATVRNVTAIAPGLNGVAIWASSNSLGGNADVTVVNTIARGTAADLYARDPYGYSARIGVSHSNFRPGYAVTEGTGEINQGSGNQSADPIFVSPSDYRQQGASPTVDAGTAATGLGAQDIDGDPRNLGTAPDIGADEFVPQQATPPQPSDTPPTTPSQTTTVPPTSSRQVADQTAPNVRLRLSRPSLRTAVSRGLAAVVRYSEHCTIRVSATVDRRTARRLRLRRTRVAVGRGIGETAPGTVKVRLRFSSRAKPRLRGLRSLRLTVKAVVTDDARNKKTIRKNLILRR
jgi:hypothetical protein